SHLVSKGFTYDGLDINQAVQLDEFGCDMWAPECLGAALDPQGLAWLGVSEVGELLFRAGHLRSWRYLAGPQPMWFPRSKRPSMLGLIVSWVRNRQTLTRPSSLARTSVRLLRLLKTGRRFGTEAKRTRGNGCYYVVFSPAELVELRQEV